MTLVALASLKAAPGATTAAVLLAGVWPHPDVVLVEADPDGGSLMTRFDLPADGRGMTSLAGAARRRLTPELVWQHTQSLPGGLLAVPVSPAPAQAAAAVSQLGRPMVAVLGGAPQVDAIVDCGRLSATSPARAIAEAAEVLVLVCRPRLEELRLALLHLEERPPPSEVGLLLVGDGYSARAVERFLADRVAVSFVASFPQDRRAAEALVDGVTSPRALRHSPLVRAARGLAGKLDHLLDVEQARRAS